MIKKELKIDIESRLKYNYFIILSKRYKI